jgi:hypothetical protein
MSHPLLRGAFDLHVHCSPDVVPRAQDFLSLAHAAQAAGMAGIGLKDHTTSTVDRCYALNSLFPNGPHFFSAIALNPPVGGLNPAAVEAALGSGVDIIYFPTYAARYHIETLGPEITPVPHPRGGVQAISVCDVHGNLSAESQAIVELIAEADAVLATGHISPPETLTLLKYAAERNVKRLVVTHASEVVPNMSVAEQREAVSYGALIEHCFLATTQCCPGNVPLEMIASQIREVGIERVILSSDFGQPANGPPVQGFAERLERLLDLGFSPDDVRQMIVANPSELLKGRFP